MQMMQILILVIARNAVTPNNASGGYYSSGISISPELMSVITSCGALPSTVHPMLWAVPSISLTHAARSLDSDLNFMVRAMSIISSMGMLPVCLMFFSFLRSRGGSGGTQQGKRKQKRAI
jgi:hypothetical protein